MLYLVHLEHPIIVHTKFGPRRVQHYLGWAKNVEARISEHRATRWERWREPVTVQHPNGRVGTKSGELHGDGSLLLGLANSLGIPWRVTRQWPGTPQEEARLKRHRNNRRLCPECSEEDRCGQA